MNLRDISLIELIIIVAILGIIAALITIAPALKAEQDSWMADCTKHEPRYSCEVKWKQMHPDPVVVVAPLNR